MTLPPPSAEHLVRNLAARLSQMCEVRGLLLEACDCDDTPDGPTRQLTLTVVVRGSPPHSADLGIFTADEVRRMQTP